MNAPDLLKSIDRYEILEEVGRGATSVVYAARDIFSGDKVAVKCQEFDFGAESNRAQVMETFFRNEAALAGKLSHPFIAGVLDAGREGNLRYIVMEFIEGKSLRPFCDPENLLPLDQVLDIIFKCCLALEHSSQRGVIHRDIKPANIIRMPDGNVKIADFGAAIVASEERTVVTGVGSPAYMSPEQASEQPLDFHTDMYSLGVVAFHLLTGQLPFQADSSLQLLQRIVNDTPPTLSSLRPDLPKALDEVIGRAISKKPKERYETFGDFARELSQLTSQVYLPASQITDTEKFNSLRKLSFFADFKDAEIWEVVHMSQWQRCRRGTIIIKEGERGNEFCILAQGEATVTRQGREVGLIKAGECFGEMLYLSSGRIARSASVTSKTDAVFLVINPAQLERASFQCQVHFNKRFFEALVNRLLDADKRIAAL
jgi:serine/threonine protein kinase